MKSDAIKVTSVPTERLIIVCGKCTRKLHGGFGKKRKHALRSVLRDALKTLGRRRDVRAIETGCLGLCPRDAVTVADSRRPGDLLSVPSGMAAETILAGLGVTRDTAPNHDAFLVGHRPSGTISVGH